MFKTERKIYVFSRSSHKKTIQKSNKLSPHVSTQYCLMYCSNSHDMLYDCTLLSGLVILIATMRKIIYGFKQWQSEKSLRSFYNFSLFNSLIFLCFFFQTSETPENGKKCFKQLFSNSFYFIHYQIQIDIEHGEIVTFGSI